MNALLVWLAAMVLLATLGLWLLFFPDARSGAVARMRATANALGVRMQRGLQRARARLRHDSRHAGTGMSHVWLSALQHRILVAVLGVLLLAPAGLILALRQHATLQGYSPTVQVDRNTANLVTSLLQGERLVPPPPLPPAVFITREVEREAPHLHLGSANRNWALLNPRFRQRLLAVFKIMRDRYGYQMALIEGYRSPGRQAQLAAEGTDVTRAGAGQSYHQYGLAADCAFYRNGQLVVSAKHAWAQRGYTLYGQVAEAAGLVWGGSWRHLRDLGHVELHIPGLGPRRRD